MARPTTYDENMKRNLRAAFLIGASKEEAATYVGVSEKTLYNWLKRYPELVQEIEGWRLDPILKAKKKVVEDIENDVNTAKWYLERKRSNEFSTKSQIDATVTNRNTFSDMTEEELAKLDADLKAKLSEE